MSTWSSNFTVKCLELATGKSTIPEAPQFRYCAMEKAFKEKVIRPGSESHLHHQFQWVCLLFLNKDQQKVTESEKRTTTEKTGENCKILSGC